LTRQRKSPHTEEEKVGLMVHQENPEEGDVEDMAKRKAQQQETLLEEKDQIDQKEKEDDREQPLPQGDIVIDPMAAANKPQEASTSPAERGSKTEAVKRALAALGNHAKPQEMHAWIVAQTGLDVPMGTISTIKSQTLNPKDKTSQPRTSPGTYPSMVRPIDEPTREELKRVKSMIDHFEMKILKEVLTELKNFGSVEKFDRALGFWEDME